MIDRFDLRESAVRRSNVFQPSKSVTARSYISTAIVNDSIAYGDDLRKSRIQNLPNYKKSNLGDSINFVVVFQTIEIERLSNQIEVLRVRLKEAERQLFNAANYEVQIKELTEKCFAYESKLQEYKDEVEKLNNICQSLYHDNEQLNAQLSEIDYTLKQKFENEKQKNQDLIQEIEKWKSRYQATERSKAKELEELRNMMESQRKSMIDRQIREMAIRFQNERGSLEGEIRKLREMLSNREGQIENYRQKCQRYEIENMELRNNEHVIADLENKLAMISNELMRVTQVLKSKDDDIQLSKKRQYDLALKLKEQADWENDNRNLRDQLDSKAKQIEDWRARSSRLEEEAVRGKEMALYNNQLSNKLGLAQREIQRMNGLLRAKMDEVEQWKQRLSAKDAQLTQYKNLQNDIAQSENKANMLKVQNDRVNGILKSRLEEIEGWKRKNNELQEGLSRMGLLEKDRKMFEEKFNSQIKHIEELNFIINKAQSQNEGLKKTEGRCRDLEDKLEATTRELERLNNLIRGKEQEANDSRIKLSRLENSLNQFKTIQIQMKDSESKIALMTQQIDRLNNLIKDKNEDISTLEQEKIELYSLVNQYKNYEIKIQQYEQAINRLQNDLKSSRTDLQGANAKLRAAEMKFKDFQSNLFSQSQEKDKASTIARQKTQECEDLKNRVSSYQNQLRKMGELQTAFQQLKNQNLVYYNDFENMQRKARELESLYGKQKASSQELKSKLGSATAELQRLANQMKNSEGKKSREFNDLQDHYSRVLTKVKSKDSEIEVLTSKITQMESLCSQLKKEFNRLLEAFQQSYKDTVTLSERIAEYQDYAKKIHILGGELDRLAQLNKGLEEDNKIMRLKYSNNINFQKKEQEYQLVSVLMGVEIESLRMRLSQREVSLEQMRQSILEPIRRV